MRALPHALVERTPKADLEESGKQGSERYTGACWLGECSHRTVVRPEERRWARGDTSIIPALEKQEHEGLQFENRLSYRQFFATLSQKREASGMHGGTCREAEADRSLQVQVQHCLYRELQARQGYMISPCLKITWSARELAQG